LGVFDNSDSQTRANRKDLKMNLKKISRFLVNAQTISLFLHLLLFAFLFPIQPTVAPKQPTLPTDIKIVISKTEIPISRNTPKPSSPSPKPPKNAMIAKKVPAYSEFFPQDLPISNGTSGNTNTLVHPKFRNFDEEGSDFSEEVKERNFSEIESFARELSQRITLPRSFINLVGNGETFLRFNRNPDAWKIKRVTGNRYLRAVLFETVNKFKDSTYLSALLEKIDYDSLRIYLSYRTVSVLDKTLEPLILRTDANKIFLTITQPDASSLWKMGMPIDNDQGDDLVIPNLIGIGSIIIDAFSNPPETKDQDVRKLRHSPAFLRPIGR